MHMGRKPSLIEKLKRPSRHFVSLVWFQQNANEPAGEKTWKNFAAAGFVMSFGGTWYLGTAGHILEDLEENRKARATRTNSFALVDHGGVEADFTDPVPFDFENAVKHYVVDANAGLDFGFIKIAPFYRKLLEANQVVPLTEEHWKRKQGRSRIYVVMGCPSVRRRIKQETDFEPRTGHAQITVMHVRALAKKDEPEPLTYPRLFGRVLDEKVPDIDGFSGGPVIRLGPKKGGVIPYAVVAMQYSWDKRRRVIRASPLAVFGTLFEEQLASKRKRKRS